MNSPEKLLREMRELLDEGGLRARMLVRDLDTGAELGIEPDTPLPSSSLVKVALALATVERIRRGELDGSTPLGVRPGRVTTPGPTGISRFRHPVRIAVDDLLYLSTCLSDSAAAEALFDLTPPDQVAGLLGEFGISGITVRHSMRELADTPAERFDAAQAHLAHALAIDSGTGGSSHRVPQLDITHASNGSARAYVDLLQALWRPSRIPAESAARLRELLAHNVLRQRLSPDFASDATTWSSKTATLLNLRHEIGVVEHSDGQAFAVAVLTESRVPAQAQPGAEALMAQVARTLRDYLRQL
ncbi:serine hydrolase [Streptomyces cavernicola]|uniref:Class A beta-lactamase-related serine hydrolase n=1 Tax=Streptomyces cavernicola TaxID=3043613 RepID=A0ABT6SBB7_9ACTN|nr:serine hydrolase [Streptomyces sp. B-S-A6]MDI3404962.1 class A beta-lactamase-related serine hydrolase [Streptomyces sp. B-S-A6]